MISKYLTSKSNIINKYIDNLYKGQLEILSNSNRNKNKEDNDIFMANIITSLNKASILNLCLYYFLVVYTYQNTDEDKNYVAAPLSIKIGKRIFYRYINKLKDEYKE